MNGLTLPLAFLIPRDEVRTQFVNLPTQKSMNPQTFSCPRFVWWAVASQVQRSRSPLPFKAHTTHR